MSEIFNGVDCTGIADAAEENTDIVIRVSEYIRRVSYRSTGVLNDLEYKHTTFFVCLIDCKD